MVTQPLYEYPKLWGLIIKHCQTGCRMRYHLLDEFQNKMPLVTTPDCRVRILSHKVINMSSYISDFAKSGGLKTICLFLPTKPGRNPENHYWFSESSTRRNRNFDDSKKYCRTF